MSDPSELLLNRVDEMEIKITLIEQANEEMSDVIFAQQSAIDRLKIELKQAKSQMEKLSEQIDSDNSPPPHY